MFEFESNQEFAGKYTLIEQIGKGGFAEVWKVERASGFIQAIKIFSGLNSGGADLARKEFERIYNLNHRNLLKPSDWGVYRQHPYLVLPFCAHGNVLKLAGKIGEEELAKIIYDIASALEYLHSLDDPIIHQDLKPDNILIDDNFNYLLSDFGISRKLKITFAKSTMTSRETVRMEGHISAGTAPPAYRPPEYYSTDLEEKKLTKASDIWAFGITIFELATNELAFGEHGGLTQFQGANPPDLPMDQFTAGLNYLIHWCLEETPEDRLSAKELKDMAHSYLTIGTWDFSKTIPAKTPSTGLSEPLKVEKNYKWWRWVPFALLFLFLAGLGYLLVFNAGNTPQKENREEETFSFEQDTELLPGEKHPDLSRFNIPPSGSSSIEKAPGSSFPDILDGQTGPDLQKEEIFSPSSDLCAEFLDEIVTALNRKDKKYAERYLAENKSMYSETCQRDIKEAGIYILRYENTEINIQRLKTWIKKGNVEMSIEVLKLIENGYHPAFKEDLEKLKVDLDKLPTGKKRNEIKPAISEPVEQTIKKQKLWEFEDAKSKGDACLKQKNCDCAEIEFNKALDFNIDNDAILQKLVSVQRCWEEKNKMAKTAEVSPQNKPTTKGLESEKYHSNTYSEYTASWRGRDMKREEFVARKKKTDVIVELDLDQNLIRMINATDKNEFRITGHNKKGQELRNFQVVHSSSGKTFTVTLDLKNRWIDFEAERSANRASGDRFYLN